MNKMRISCLVLLLAAGLGRSAQAAERDKALIVMPVRYTVVQFAFDVARIRPVDLLAYDEGVGDEPLVLYTWNVPAAAWRPVDLAAFRAGTLFPSKPQHTFLIGAGDDVPPEIAEGAGWSRDLVQIPSLKVVDMANSINRTLRFSESEWKRLARRHNLQLTDENAERRRYGRYGKPGTPYEGPRPVNPLMARLFGAKKDKDPTPPAPLEEDVETEPVDSDKPVEEPAWKPGEEKDVAPSDPPDAGEAEAVEPAAVAAEGPAEDSGASESAPSMAPDTAAEDK